jgi:hypothetical protein
MKIRNRRQNQIEINPKWQFTVRFFRKFRSSIASSIWNPLFRIRLSALPSTGSLLVALSVIPSGMRWIYVNLYLSVYYLTDWCRLRSDHGFACFPSFASFSIEVWAGWTTLGQVPLHHLPRKWSDNNTKCIIHLII